MGTIPAPEVFHCKLNHTYSICQTTIIADDDILLVGGGGGNEVKAIQDRDKKLCVFSWTAAENAIENLTPDEVRLRLKEVPYVGHLLTVEGMKADPGKVEAIQGMPRPVDVKVCTASWEWQTNWKSFAKGWQISVSHSNS